MSATKELNVKYRLTTCTHDGVLNTNKGRESALDWRSSRQELAGITCP